MTSNVRSHRSSAFAWLAIGSIITVSTTYILLLRAQQQSLHVKIAALSEGTERLRRELKEGEELRRHAEDLFRVWRAHDEAMIRMLRKCQSREDFVVREGSRIAWSELGSSTADSTKIGIYVPTGSHRLKYAMLNGKTLRQVERKQFRSGNARNLGGATGWDLPPTAEVYELELRYEVDRPLRIVLTGRDNVRIHGDSLPLFQGPCEHRDIVMKHSFAFPSELKIDDNARPYFQRPMEPPVTDLALLQLQERDGGGRLAIRLWIESEARACLPALDVAANYQRITSLRFRRGSRLSPRATDADSEFERLFKPYDGSRRYYFREGIFSKGLDNSG